MEARLRELICDISEDKATSVIESSQNSAASVK